MIRQSGGTINIQRMKLSKNPPKNTLSAAKSTGILILSSLKTIRKFTI
jgi:hypothetical protein